MVGSRNAERAGRTRHGKLSGVTIFRRRSLKHWELHGCCAKRTRGTLCGKDGGERKVMPSEPVQVSEFINAHGFIFSKCWNKVTGITRDLTAVDMAKTFVPALAIDPPFFLSIFDFQT